MGLLIHPCLETPRSLPFRNKLKITWSLSFTRILVLIMFYILFVLQHDSFPQQSKSDQLEKMKVFKTMLERIITFLQVSKSNIPPGFKDKLGSYEVQRVNFINTNWPKKPALQQGQLPAPHMQSVLSHENQINLQFQSMNLQDNSMSDWICLNAHKLAG